MAHGVAKKQAVRGAYVFERLTIEQAAMRAGVPVATATRWKRAAKKSGEDWDKLRAATLLAGEGVEAVARQMLGDYVTQHQALMESITKDATLEASAKVSMLASLADSFNKTVAASRRVLPETSELATALTVLGLFGDFVRDRFPQHAAVFLEVLEPFGDILPQHFSRQRGL